MKQRSMTDAQRRALHLASHKRGRVAGAEVIRARRAQGAQVTNAMANKLQARGWATREGNMLVISDEGRKALRAPIPEDAPVYLHQRDGLTNRRDQAVRDEGEIIDPKTLKAFWTEEAERRRAAAQDRRQEARKLRDQMRAA